MKREILFRGKKQSTGEWVYGSLITNEKPGLHTIAQVNSNPVQNGVLTGWCFGVIPETVGQFTGLTDKNGKRIFEGDVVKYGNLYPNFTVKWDYESAMFKHCHKIHTDRIEIIGNIHDKPELQ